ncbi:branched-chain amino acid ABC transporter permease [Bosea sp. LjRoot90]|uniref:branched-chain amino acid ABC transporter permease n=1 Tax=Bosea sp. LjRoot90 TaxID=3342342 RepID=UPI003ED14E26
MSDISIGAAAAARKNWLLRDFAGIGLILALAAVGYLLFPNNLSLLTRIIGIALLVLSLDLITGYCGVATLGQSALFGAGAYLAGIAAVRWGIHDPLLMIGLGAIGGAVMAALSGAIILRGHGLTQLVLSIAIAQMLQQIANKASTYTGGSDGLAGIEPSPIFGLFAFDLWGRTAYGLAVALLAVIFLLLRILTRSPFGMLCRGAKEDPVRVRAMGASVRSTLLKAYVISGAVAGVGGALTAISTQVVGLDSLSFQLSAQSLVMLVVGGTGTLYGALLGAVSFVLFEDLVSAANPFHWLTIVGALLVVVVLFAPKGLYGGAAALVARFRTGGQ